MEATPRTTVAGIVSPHLLRVVDLANQAEQGVNVDWHVREAVAGALDELGELFIAPVAVAAYVDGLENAASQAPKHRQSYARVLACAVEAARRLRRE